MSTKPKNLDFAATQVRLTYQQRLWIFYLDMVGDHTTNGKKAGCKPLQALINLGLVRAIDSSYPMPKKYLPQITYRLTQLGENLYFKNRDLLNYDWSDAGGFDE